MRKGSALLTVLGMLSFIVVSAVGFLFYMRQTRLPSSFLRRTSSSRLLVKAALAEAIDELDRGIGGNLYPGVGHWGKCEPYDTGMANYFCGRVFIGSTNVLRMVEPEETVSTLTLEALAYLPPAIVNDVRYYSRRTNTAKWQPLSFDAGRYAYCAVDVSDCLDINALRASTPRSSAPDSRISLAYLFRDESGGTGETSSGKFNEGDLKVWDDFIDARDLQGKMRLTSLADLNLAMYGFNPGMFFKSPWAQYVMNGGGTFYVGSGGDAMSAEGKKYARQLFVTDSWFPGFVGSNETTVAAFDISDPQNQPFYGRGSDDENSNDQSLMNFIQSQKNNFFNRFTDNIKLTEEVCLYDYLDKDSVPVTLALPTAEKTPMIVGLDVAMQKDSVKFGVMRHCIKGEAKEEGKTRKTLYDYYFYLTPESCNGDFLRPTVLAGLAYPFKYAHGNNASGQFKAQVAVKLFFVPSDLNCEAMMRPSSAGNFTMRTNSEWTKGVNGPAGGVITFVSDPKPISVNDTPEKVADILCSDIMAQFDQAPNQAYGKDGQYVYHVQHEKIEMKDEMGWKEVSFDQKGDPSVKMDFVNAAFEPANMAIGGSYKLCMAVYARVIDSNNNTVDQVPAGAVDDKDGLDANFSYGSLKGRPLMIFPFESSDASVLTCGNRPLTTFPEFDPKDENELTPQACEAKLAYKWCITDDPRWNFAPENFCYFNTSEGGELAKRWLDKCTVGQGSKDPDPFMNVSDQGYMQSVYEFAFLPRASGFAPSGDVFGQCQSEGYNGALRSSMGALCAADCMWNTYTFFNRNGQNDTSVLEEHKINIVNGEGAFRINPLTPSTNIMMAAIANTPMDWWAAGTNLTINGWGSSKPVMSKAMEYTIGPEGQEIYCEWSKLWDLSARLVRLFRTGNMNEQGQDESSGLGLGSAKWQDQFDNLDWDTDEPKMLANVDFGVDLHAIDRKYLHAFWKESFDYRQQLFLIFVRAEPAMMGSGAVGQVPPQLGGRAVALVWRDPFAKQLGPHKTRVLFYRQLD
jgi:hypothetical protein